MKRRKVPKRKKVLRDPYFEPMMHRTGSGAHTNNEKNEQYMDYLLNYTGEIDETYFDEIDELF